MRQPPFEVIKELDGWVLFWAELRVHSNSSDQLETLRSTVTQGIRARLTLDTLSGLPAVAALRRLFKAAGCDPSRYRPSSEALLRRILKGEELPSIHALVDVNNCLSLELGVPCCVMSAEAFIPPVLLRSGQPGESYESLRGPFNLEGKPLLLDTLGPLDAPITGSQRVKVVPETTHAWLVAYLPAPAVEPSAAEDALRRLVRQASCVELLQTAAS